METEYIKDWKHRAQGATEIVLGGLLLKFGSDIGSFTLLAGGSLFLTEGIGDLATGYHHYCFQRGIDGIKYVRNSLGK